MPFAMRRLHAELPQYTGLPHQALDRLYVLQGICRQIIINLKNGLTEDGSEMEMTNENREGWYRMAFLCYLGIYRCFHLVQYCYYGHYGDEDNREIR